MGDFLCTRKNIKVIPSCIQNNQFAEQVKSQTCPGIETYGGDHEGKSKDVNGRTCLEMSMNIRDWFGTELGEFSLR